MTLSDNQRDCLLLLVKSVIAYAVMCLGGRALSMFWFQLYSDMSPGAASTPFAMLARQNMALLLCAECASCVCLLAAFAVGKKSPKIERAIRSRAGVFVTFFAVIRIAIMGTRSEMTEWVIVWPVVAALYWLHGEVMCFGVWKFGEKPCQ